MAGWLKNQFGRAGSLIIKHQDDFRILTEVIFKYSGVRVGFEDLVWRGRTVYLKVKPLAKSEILIKQKFILREWQDLLGRRAPRRLI